MVKKKRMPLIFFSIICFFVCAFCYVLNVNAYCFFLLPLLYSICLILFHKSYQNWGKFPGLTVIHIVMFLRYVFVPLLLCITDKISIYANNYKYINLAIFLMAFEMICIFAALNFTSSNCKKEKLSKKSYLKNLPSVNSLNATGIIVLIVLLGLYMTNRSLINDISQVTKGTVIENIGKKSSALSQILWQCLLSWFCVYLIFIQKIKYEKGNRTSSIMLSVLFSLLFIFLIYLGQSRISRWYPLVCGIASLYILLECFTKEKKKITLFFLIPVGILLFTVSIFKMTTYSNIEMGNNVFSDLFSATNLDAYFAGPVSVNNAIGLYVEYNIGFKNIVYDIFNNFPILNKYIATENSTAYLYNQYVGRIFESGRGDQIIPLVGQSMIFFTPLFAPLLSVISVFVLRFFDKHFKASNDYLKYIYAFAGVWFSVITVLNMTIALSWVYIRIIPLLVVFKGIKFLSNNGTGSTLLNKEHANGESLEDL